MMKLIIRCLMLLAVVSPIVNAANLAGLRAELGRKWPQNRTLNLVFHGHSVPAGYHRTPEVKSFDSYPQLLLGLVKSAYPNAVVNAIVTAIGGEDSVAGAARFERDVLSHRPDLVFIDYALNDRRKPLAEVEKAWRTMITAARKAGVPVVLLTPTGDAKADLSNPADPLREQADLIRRLAKDEQVLLADVSAAWVAELAKGTPQGDLLSQGNHPNRRGHELAAKCLFDCISTVSAKPSPKAP